MWKKLFEKRIWNRIYTERLGEPIIYNLVSLFILLFGNIVQKIKYDLVPRTPYSFGLDLAFRETQKLINNNKLNIKRIIIIEFGVASGAGLMNLANTSKKLSKYYNIDTQVVGFDSGKGMPKPMDYRDHPEKYLSGDFVPSDLEMLKSNLPDNARIYFGDIKDSIIEFEKDLLDGDYVGYIINDFDYYSSTKAAFTIFDLQQVKFLPRTVMYFDDIQDIDDHEFAGELLAIKDFNNNNEKRKIVELNQLRYTRIFKNSVWLKQMFWYMDFNNLFFSYDFHKDRERVELTNPYL